MNSWNNIQTMLADYDTYLGNNYTGNVKWITENNPLTIDQMLSRKDIPGLRISLYEEPENVLTRVGANNQFDKQQAYQLQLFFIVARIGDYDTIVEKELMTFKDLADDWANQVDAGLVTTNELLTFQWDSVNRIDRQEEYSLLEINFGAFRQRT